MSAFQLSTTDIIGHHLADLEGRWHALSANPKHVNEWTPAEQTECAALSQLVPLLRWQLSAAPNSL